MLHPPYGSPSHRKVDWQGVGTETDTTTTDDQGTFQFPAKYMASLKHGVVPEEMVAITQIQVEVAGKPEEIMVAIKRYYKEGAELGGRQNFHCEIHSEPQTERFGASIVESRCQPE